MSVNDRSLPCEATTEQGERCALPALPGSPYCLEHQEDAVAIVDEVMISVTESSVTDQGVEEEIVAAVASSATIAGKNGDLQLSDDELRAKIREEIRRLSQRVETPAPGQTETKRAESGLLQMMRDSLSGMTDSEWLDPAAWQGIAMVAQIAVDVQRDFVARRLRGEYDVDEWGYDQEIANYFALVAGLMYNKYWRVELTGVEHIPNFGRALLVANHSGVLPTDGAMIAYGISEHHPAHRLARAMVANLFPSLPFFSSLLNKTGQVLAHPDNGRRLLESDELVLVFPEGYKGVGKLFKDRYKLARFGRGGFVKMAVEAQAPILPVAVVGAEETYPMLANIKPIARLIGFPFFPITPTFPLLGLFGVVPLPSKWYIDIGEPIDTSQLDPESIQNPAYLSDLTDMVRNRVQEMIDKRLAARRSIFFG
jgi:1-acyl-sn-glycerol-3-phosphate acyltransferase